MRKNQLIIFLWLMCWIARSQDYHICHPKDVRYSPRERYIDMHHLKLEIEPNAIKGEVNGLAILSFTPLWREVDSIWLDAVKFDVHSIKLNGKPVRFINADSGIAIFPHTLGRKEANYLEIKYRATPEKGMYFTGWDDPTGRGRKQIWTQGQGIDHRHWIPYYDEQHDKLTTEIVVYFDSRYKVVSNGILLSADTIRDKIKWHYLQNMPHPGYLIMIAVGDYNMYSSLYENEGRQLEFQEYMYPDVPGGETSTYRYSRFFMQKLEELLKVPYPWPGPYRQVPVADFIYGAMENTGAVIFAESLISDQYSESNVNYHQVNAHEMAHQWFGNLVTAWSARHHWLHESFATYFDLLSIQWLSGDHAFSNKIRESIHLIKAHEVKDNLPIAHSKAGNARHYQKGGVVLHMLRNLVGDEAFYKSLQVFLERYQFRNAHSDDLLYVFHEVTGRDLQWFWDQWFYGSGMPVMTFSHRVVADTKGKHLALYFNQKNINRIDSKKLFRLHFDVEIVSSKRRMITPVTVSNASDTIRIFVDKDEDIWMVNPDPGKRQLIEWVNLNENALAITKHSENAFDRVFAYQHAQKVFKVSDLEFFRDEKDSDILAMWAKAIGKNIMNPIVWNFFNKVESDKVKFAALVNTDGNFWRLRSEGELLEFANSHECQLKFLVYLLAISAGPERLEFYKKVIQIPEKFTLQKMRLLIAITEYNINKSNENIRNIASFASTEFRGAIRAEAMEFLTSIDYRTDELINICVHALGHYDRTLPLAAAGYLKKVAETQYKELIQKELKKYEKIWPEWKIKKAYRLLEA
ncbi:M1 family metallopeptidase [Schleiferia thermophila]|uniref:M1 family metallopeptidase n=1 Tax=Schleiferia thermophila TaxID=884107 RepID=UPI000A02371D|nr:M1 family metallopeptidase [Schleiferia thermophila]